MNLFRDPIILLALCLAMAWGVDHAFSPPEPASAAAPGNSFSAVRAGEILDSLYAENQSHPSGSKANQLVQERIVEFLTAAGYQPEVQRRFHCNATTYSCSPVENIVAVRRGSDGKHALLVTAHYDSVRAGAGVADDGAGVATVLEIARMMTTQPDVRHSVIFLLTDAEELGLIGADAFASHHPLFEQVRLVVNVEARGVTGASSMFEVGEGNRGLIRLLSSSVEKPVANSLTYEVYKRMPNDTDFSVYRQHGRVGFNFAFTRGVQVYHTQIDDLAHLDRGSLQHHGDNVWSVIQALDKRSIDKMVSEENAAYIDIFSWKLLQYPESSAMGLAVVLSVLLLLTIPKAFPQQISIRQMFWVVVAIAGLVVVIPLLGWLLSWPLGHWVDLHALEHPWPWSGRVTLWLAAVWAVLGALNFITPRASVGSVTMSVWGLFVLLALALAIWIPTAGYLAVLPMLGFLLGLALDGMRWKKQPRLVFSGLFGFLAAAYLGLYFFFMLETVLGYEQSMLQIAVFIIPALAALPLLVWYIDERQPGIKTQVLLAVLIAAGCIGQQFLPGFTAERPRGMNLVYRDAATSDQAWHLLEARGSLPDRVFAGQYQFEPTDLSWMGSDPGTYTARMSGRLPLQKVELLEVELLEPGLQADQATSGGTAHHRLRVRLNIPPDLRQLVIIGSSDLPVKKAYINGQLAGDYHSTQRRSRNALWLQVNKPGVGELVIELETDETGGSADLHLRARYDLPELVMDEYRMDWPDDAQPIGNGHRAERDYLFKLDF